MLRIGKIHFPRPENLSIWEILLVREAEASIRLDKTPNGQTQTMEIEQMSEFEAYEPAAEGTNDQASAKEVRAWAAENAPDLNVGARGRLSKTVRERFTKATGREVA